MDAVVKFSALSNETVVATISSSHKKVAAMLLVLNTVVLPSL